MNIPKKVQVQAYESYRKRPLTKAAGVEEEVFLDDLRPQGEPSLVPYPRMSTLAQAEALFKFRVSRVLGWDATPVGQACWRLIGVQVRTGIAAMIPLIIGPDGLPDDEIRVINYWPGAPTLPPEVRIRYYEKGDVGVTNKDGVCGFAFGKGGLVGPGGGPFTVWPCNSPPGFQPQYADALVNVGWLGGTDHFVPSGVWRYEVKGQPPVVPPSQEQNPGCAHVLGSLLEAVAGALKK